MRQKQTNKHVNLISVTNLMHKCTSLWPTTWHLIQSAIYCNIQQQMERHYKRLKKKAGATTNKTTETLHISTTWWRLPLLHTSKNLTNITFNQEEMQLLKHGLNYSIEKPPSTYPANLIAETERAIRLWDTKMQNTYRIMATKNWSRTSVHPVDLTCYKKTTICVERTQQNDSYRKCNIYRSR